MSNALLVSQQEMWFEHLYSAFCAEQAHMRNLSQSQLTTTTLHTQTCNMH